MRDHEAVFGSEGATAQMTEYRGSPRYFRGQPQGRPILATSEIAKVAGAFEGEFHSTKVLLQAAARSNTSTV